MLSWDSAEVGQLAADLGKASYETTRRAQQVVTKSAHDVESVAKTVAPVDTGNLRNSIGTDITGGGLSAEIGPTAHYGVYVEFGTRRMAPQPYMGPGLDAATPGFVAAMGELGGGIL